MKYQSTEKIYSILQRKSVIVKMLRRVFEPLTRLFHLNIFQPKILTSLIALMFAIAVGSKEQIANIQSLTSKFVDVAPLSDTIKTKIVKVLSNREYMNNIYKVANNIKQLSSFIFPIIGISASVITALYFVKSKPTTTRDDIKLIETVSKETFDSLNEKYQKLQLEHQTLLSQLQETLSQLQSIQELKRAIESKIEQISVPHESEQEKQLKIEITRLREEIDQKNRQLDSNESKMVEDLRRQASEMQQSSSSEIKELKRQLGKFQSIFSQKENEHEEMIARNRQLEATNLELQQKISEIESQKSRHDQQLSNLIGSSKATIENVQAHIESLTIKITELTAQNQQLSADFGKNNEQKEQILQKLREEKERFLQQTKSQTFAEIQQELSRLQQLNGNLESQIEAGATQIAELTAQNQQLSADFEQNNGQKEQILQNLREEKERFLQQTKSQTFAEIQQELSRLQQLNGNLESQIEAGAKQIAELTAKNQQLSADFKRNNEQKQQLQQLREELSRLQQSNRSLESKIEAGAKQMRTILQEKQQAESDLKSKTETYQHERSQLEGSKRDLQSQLESCNLLYSQGREQLELFQKHNKQYQEQQAQLSKELATTKENLESKTSDLEESKRRIQDLNAQKSNFDSQMKQISDQILLYNQKQNVLVTIKQQRISDEIVETETKNEDIFAKLKAFIQYATSNVEQYELLKKEVEKLIADKVANESKIAVLNSEKASLEELVTNTRRLQSTIDELTTKKREMERLKESSEERFRHLTSLHDKTLEENRKLQAVLQQIASGIGSTEIKQRSSIEQIYNDLVSYITQLKSNCVEMAVQREQLIQSDILSYFQMKLQMKISFLEKPANMFDFKNSGYYTVEKQSDGREIVKFNERTWVYFTSEISDDKKQAFVKFVEGSNHEIQHFLQKLYVMEKLLEFIENLNFIFTEGFLENITNSIFESDVHSSERKSVPVDMSQNTDQKRIEMMTEYMKNNRADSYANLQERFLQEFLQNHNWKKTDDIVNLWMFLLRQTNFDSNFAGNSSINEIKDVVFSGQNACEFYKQKSLRIESEPELMKKMMAEWLGISLEQLSSMYLLHENLPWNNRNDDNLISRQLKTFVKALLPPNESNTFLISYIENCLKHSQNFKDWCILQSKIFDFYTYELRFDINSLIQNETNQTNIMIQIFQNVNFGDEKYFDDNINIVFISEVISVMIVDIYMNQYPAKEVDADIYNEDKIRDIRRQYIELFKIRLQGDQERQTLDTMLQTYKKYFVVFFVEFYEKILRHSGQFVPLAIIATLYKIKISKPSLKIINVSDAKTVFKKVIFRLVTWIMLLFYRNSCLRPDEKIQEILTIFHDHSLQNQSSQSNPYKLKHIKRKPVEEVPEVPEVPGVPEMKDREELPKTEKRRERELFRDESFTEPTKRRHIDENAQKANEEQKNTEEYGLAKISSTMTNFFLYLISDVEIQIPDNMLCNSNLNTIKNLIEIYFAKLQHIETFWESANHELEKIIFGQSKVVINNWILSISKIVQLPKNIYIIQNL
jgi:hypothetical protein